MKRKGRVGNVVSEGETEKMSCQEEESIFD